MKAMVFAAGLGTRLRPLTDDRPKALVEVNGMSLLEIQLRRLKAFGISTVVINIHHFADLMVSRIQALQKSLEMELLVSDERDAVLETGGGLLKAAPLLAGSEPILIVNVDVLTNLNYGLLQDTFQKQQALAVLAIRNRPTSRYLVWDSSLRLRGWKNMHTGEVKGNLKTTDQLEAMGWQALAFSGIQIISPKFISLMTQRGKFSIIDPYLSLAGDHLIRGYQHDEDVWLDVGKPETLAQATAVLDQILT